MGQLGAGVNGVGVVPEVPKGLYSVPKWSTKCKSAREVPVVLKGSIGTELIEQSGERAF